MRTPLLRPARLAKPWAKYGRRISGASAAIAAHLGLNPSLVRWLFVISAFFGVGVVFYIWVWVFVPEGDPWRAAQAQRHNAIPVQRSRLAARLRLDTGFAAGASPMSNTAVQAALIGVALVMGAFGVAVTGPSVATQLWWLIPLLLCLLGVVVIWVQIPAMAEGGALKAWAWTGAGSALVVVGIMAILLGVTEPIAALQGAGVTVVILLVLALALSPLWSRMMRQLGVARAQEARQAERADIAAHLHDSVLQTLALIRSRASSPQEVARLARAQERELREWLYSERPEDGSSIVQAIKTEVGRVEDMHAVSIDTVSVGDALPSESLKRLVSATREALSNAARHGAEPISLYIEAGHEGVEVFVRDHGPGFDVAQVPQGRHGVKQSIIERVERYGGRVAIVRRDPGVEVRMWMPSAAPSENGMSHMEGQN